MDQRRQGEINTPQYVVDASVIAKWILPGEPFQTKAIKLKEDHVLGIAELNAPSLIMQEVANALWKATKLKRISLTDAKEALKALSDLRIKLHQSDWAQTSEELSLAYNLNLTIYDATYISIADKMKIPLITADQKLYKTAQNHFKIIHIKEYP